MPDQYVATDKRTGFEVSVTGEFPEHPDDRMRIARTTTLFTRLMSTLLEKEETQRRLGFRAIETQLELADALIRQEHEEVRRLLRDTLSSMGVDEQQMRDLAERLMDFGGVDPAVRQELARAFGFDSDSDDAPPGLENMPDLEQLLDPKVMAAIGEALDASEPELSAADLEVLEAAEKARAAVEKARAAAEEARNTKDEAALAAAEQALDAANEALDAAHAALANLQEADEQASEQSGESDHPEDNESRPGGGR